MTILRDWDLKLDADRVLWGQGMDAARVRQRRPRLAEMAEQALVEGTALLEPSVVFARCKVTGFRHERLELEGGRRLQGPLMASHLAGAQEVIAAVCTVGERIGQRASQVFESDPALSLALEGVAAAATEALGEAACRRFETLAHESGLSAGIPLNPGMVGWPLMEAQQQVFALVDAAPIGVILTESGLMMPLKSLSLVLGLGEKMDQTAKSCDLCAMRETCRYQAHYNPA